MKKLPVIFLIGLMTIGGMLIFPRANRRAEVISKSGHWLILDKGSSQGVRPGLTGIVKTIMKENDKEYDINVGYFVIRSTAENTSRAYITQVAPGMNVGQAKYVEFYKKLIPPRPPPPPPPTIDQYLEQGERAFERGNYQSAMKYFEEALKLDPDNLVAKNFYKECKNEIKKQADAREEQNRKQKSDNYIEKGDKYVTERKVEIGIGYYLTAYNLFHKNKAKIAEKLFFLWQSDKSVETYLLKDGGEAGKQFLGNIYIRKAEENFNNDHIEESNKYLEKARQFLDESDLAQLKEKVARALQKRKGTLQVSAYPFADVYVNGKWIGEVPPVKKILLQTGKHRVRLVNSEKGVVEKTVLITFNKTTKVHHKFGD